MSPEFLLTIAIIVFALMSLGLVLTYLEFNRGAPKKQEEGEQALRKSPHGDV
jgi:hypothetical protein